MVERLRMAAGLSLALLPVGALLEGCNQMPIHLRLAHIFPGDDCGGGLDCDLGRREFVYRAGYGVVAGSGVGGGLLVVLARALARSLARRRGVAE